ncbi:MAG: plastocyanin/azurin family copper-binding protein [Thaumarchaeota archaeon]|nr:plastocyanin/azurin family copper-binding protein [Nitrososphaerota archaeon]
MEEKDFLMKQSHAVLTAVSAGIVFAAALAVPMVLSGYSGLGSAHPSSPFFGGMMATQGQAISLDQAIQMMRSVPQYANVMPSNNTVIFSSNSSQSVRVVALATDHQGAANLTTNTPPSYATDDLFVIYGLIDPTLVIPHGASVQVTVVNLDKDMYHNFAVTTVSPPYSYMTMMQGMMSNRQQSGTWLSMMPFLPPANYKQGIAHEYTYTFTLTSQQATLRYLCTYPGHAQDGMYGKILVN